MKLINNRRAGRTTVTLALLSIVIALFAMGCQSTGSHPSTFKGSRKTVYPNGTEFLSVHSDGTYDQVLVGKSGRKLVTQSQWYFGKPVPGYQGTSAWIVLRAQITPWEWLDAKPNVKVTPTDLLIPTDTFDGQKEAAAPATTSAAQPSYRYGTDRAAELRQLEHAPIFIVFGFLITALWIFGLYHSARNGRYGWMIVIALFGCCGLVLYVPFAMFMPSPASARQDPFGPNPPQGYQ